MEAREIMLYSYEHCEGFLQKGLEGLTQKEAAWQYNEECNSIAWILWHFTRGEDNRVNALILHEREVFEKEGWQEKLGIPVPLSDRGAGNTLEQVKAWHKHVPKLELLKAYHNSVYKKTVDYIKSATPEKLSEVTDPGSNLPTAGLILARRLGENAMHIGHICFLRGIQRGFNK
ncbi:MAG: DinB family protein [Chloroflexi bacterium]|nr:DinB family protein [Chloroflexota bacterium]MBI2980328.1 DinB family protein [Chloroflexota bacterium]